MVVVHEDAAVLHIGGGVLVARDHVEQVVQARVRDLGSLLGLALQLTPDRAEQQETFAVVGIQRGVDAP